MQSRRLPARITGLVLVLVAALGLVALNEWSHQQARASLERIDAASRTRATLHQVVVQLLALETATRSYLLTGDERQVARFEQAAAALDGELGRLRALARRGDGPAAERVSRLEADLRRQLLQSEFILQQQAQEQAPAWQALVASEDGRRRALAIEQQIATLLDDSSERREINRHRIDRALALARLGIPLAVAMAGLAGLLYWQQLQARSRAREGAEDDLRKERDRLDALVRERTASLAALASHLQQVREDERGHLANELHDELGALLTAARLDMARLTRRLDPVAPEVGALLAHIQHLLGEGIALKRRIIEDLRPSSLANLGLAPALEILAREFAERSGLDVASQVEVPALDAAQQLTVFRLVQESLTNVARHARARHVDILVQPLTGQLEVSVADDGRGFLPGAPGVAHHGLAGMRHRVEAIGGRLEVISRPGRGTRIHATFALTQALRLPEPGVSTHSPSGDPPIGSASPTA